ncbi:30S ribosomal protein S17 [Candidatus Pacearchaeota archaeon]|nr:30S ribosomal protein S17 [Candidatus Pacearchaeota archaeon]MBD3282928.1 30S ribosomal protein S17 [Candidatus Pacearchaeota archaeon]
MTDKKTKKKEKKKTLYIGGKSVSLRGRSFRGKVIKKFPERVVIEFERTIYIKKYERYSKRKTKLHARLPPELVNEVRIGDSIEIKECRPISKIINFIVTRKL